MTNEQQAEVLLSRYRLWGVVSTLALMIFAIVLIAVLSSDLLGIGHFLLLLWTGISWLGATALCRHSYVALMQHMGVKVALKDFLSIQLIAIVFPFHYGKTRRTVREYLLRRQKERDRPYSP